MMSGVCVCVVFFCHASAAQRGMFAFPIGEVLLALAECIY